MKILAVEDEPSSLLIIRSMVESLGHECIIATDGNHAWRSFLAHEPDVVISDWTMPGLSGPRLCQKIRVHTSNSYCYVILVTARDRPEDLLDGMSAGTDDYLVKPLRLADLRARLIAAQRVTSLHRQLFLQRAELVRLNGELSAMAARDPLTGLGNRRALEADLKVLEARVVRYGHSYCMGLLDIDRFKAFNDTYGHLAGDQALRDVADQLQGQARSGDALYRFGGDELLCLFPEQSIATAGIALERMRESVERLAIPHAANPHGVVTLSVGLARMDAGHLRPGAEVLKQADESLYRAKKQGRNRIGSLTAAG